MASGSKKGSKSRSGSGSKKGTKSRSGSGSKKGSNSTSGSGSKKGSNSTSGEKVFPSESYKKYLKQVEDSEGFDVDDFPALKNYIPGIVKPVPDGAFTRELVTRYANLAIDHYNKLNKTAYEFVNVLKATGGFLGGVEFFITFDAKKKYVADAKTFQAKVTAFSGSGIVEFVRLRKPPSPAPSVLNLFPNPPCPPSSDPNVFPQVPIKRESSENLQEVQRGVSTLSIS